MTGLTSVFTKGIPVTRSKEKTLPAADRSSYEWVIIDPPPTASGRKVGGEGLSQSASAGTSLRWFGFYDPVTGAAVEGDTWTFDHGAPDPFEGWHSNDLTENGFVAWRRITPGTWGGHLNVPAAPVLAGTSSVWVGFFEDEAQCALFKAGLGYGTDWCQELRTPSFIDQTGGGVTLSFDYYTEIEPLFDYEYIYLEQGASRTLVTSFTGPNGDPSSPIHYSNPISPTAGVPFNLCFEYQSDNSYDDQDSLYATDVGASALDNIDLVGPGLLPLGNAPPYTFESGLQGFSASACAGVGVNAGVANVASYTLLDPGCTLSGNVVEFHDGSNQHPAGQSEHLISPAVALPGSGGPFNIFAEYELYGDLPIGDFFRPFWSWAWSYYGVDCASGQKVWSDPVDLNLVYPVDPPACEWVRTFATGTTGGGGKFGVGYNIVPDDADSVRFHLWVINLDENATKGNFSPIFDNLRIGISSRATILHVPSHDYLTIQPAIDACDPGDTVLVAPGTYAGPGNKDLNFSGKNIVLLSEMGAIQTVIDCEGSGRGMIFSAGETASSIVEGFTFKNGDGDGTRGGGVDISGASPKFKSCRIESCSTVIGGGVFVESGNPIFSYCSIEDNIAADNGGGVYVENGSPEFSNCAVTANTAALNGGGVYVVDGTPFFVEGDVDNGHAVDGGGVYVLGPGSPTFQNCDIALNEASDDAGGVQVAGGGASFLNTHIFGNTSAQDGGGVVVSGGISFFQGGRIADNTCTRFGAGVNITGGGASFDGCVISANINTLQAGGGVWILLIASATFTDCLITGNTAPLNGGGVWVGMGQGVISPFAGCTIAGNETSAGSGGGVYVENFYGGSDKTPFDQTIIWGNCAGVSGDEVYVFSVSATSGVSFACSDIDSNGVDVSGGVVTYVSDNIFDDPLFCDPRTCNDAPTELGDYTIDGASPCTSSNSPCGFLIGALDVGCNPTAIDDEPPVLPVESRLYQNRPNPFNPVTTIRFDVAVATHVRLRVFDVTGRVVRTLVDRHLPVAEHVVEWDGRDDRGRALSSGVYFYRLDAGELAVTKKLVLLK